MEDREEEEKKDLITRRGREYLRLTLAAWADESAHIFDDADDWQTDFPTKANLLPNVE